MTISSVTDDRLRVKSAAQEAKTSPGTIYNWIKENRFESWVVKRRGYERGIRYIDRESFENFLRSQREEAMA
jgi:hypothetical protein